MLSTAVSRNRHSLLDDPHSPGLLPVLVEVRVDLLGKLPPHDVVQRNVDVIAIAADDLRGSTAYATPDGDGPSVMHACVRSVIAAQCDQHTE